VEEAAHLAHSLLENKAAEMDTLMAKGWTPGQRPVSMALHETVYVFILYNTAWPDENGDVHFYSDEYKAIN
jgi:L,D-transpeptidase YcbB